MLSTVAGIAFDRGLIPNLDEPVGKLVKDGGYDSPHNQVVTWRNHLQQESEWEGEMFGKNANFIGTEAFGRGEMKPRAIEAPGAHYEYNDVRINRFALSLLRLYKKQLPDVFRDEVMNPIGASSDVEVGAVHQRLRGRRRQAHGDDERRHALGRRHVDQHLRHGAVRPALAAQRQVGRQADRLASST